MPRKHREPETGKEIRLDRAMLREVAGLASRLQARHEETVSLAELESAGREVGLDPSFIREAIARLEEAHPRELLASARKREFRSIVGTHGLAVGWGMLAFGLTQAVWPVPGVTVTHWGLLPLLGPAQFVALIAPLPLMVLLGFLAGRQSSGCSAALTLPASMVPAFFRFFGALDPAGSEFALIRAIGLAIVSLPAAAFLGWQGGKLREHFFPFPDQELSKEQPLSRQHLIRHLFALQGRLESQKQRRAFLSVGVAGAVEMKRGGPDLAVEYSFGQYRQWVEGVAAALGGEVCTAAGDALVCAFPEDAGALRAARRLQEGVAEFNARHNRLAAPFRLRCGLAAGDVPVDPETPPGHVDSPVIDRAAHLQKQAEPGGIVVGEELAGRAILELGGIAPLPEPEGGEPAFAWRPGG